MLQILYDLPLSAVQSYMNIVDFFVFDNFKTKCVNITVIYVLDAMKHEPWLRSNPVSKSFLRS